MQKVNFNHTNGAGNNHFMILYADPATRMCIGRVRAWQPTSNWSRRDWPDEITEVFLAAALRCASVVQILADAHHSKEICDRALTHARTRYRQEWAFATRVQHLAGDDEADGDQADSKDALTSVGAD